MEDDSTSITANQKTTTQENSVSDSTMAKPVLVSNDTANETPATTNHLEAEFKMVLSRMAIINNYREENGLDQDAIEYLNQKIRQSTQKAYDNGWNHWVAWCKSNKKHPCHCCRTVSDHNGH